MNITERDRPVSGITPEFFLNLFLWFKAGRGVYFPGEKFAGKPVVILSGNVGEDDRVAASEAFPEAKIVVHSSDKNNE